MQCEVEALGSNKGHLTAWCLLWRWGRVTPSWNTITWYAIVFLHKMPLENNFYKSILWLCSKLLNRSSHRIVINFTTCQILFLVLVVGSVHYAKVTDVRLPSHLEPVNYKLDLVPFIIPDNFTIRGYVEIEVVWCQQVTSHSTQPI